MKNSILSYLHFLFYLIVLGLAPQMTRGSTDVEQQMESLTPLGDYGYGATIAASGDFAIVGNRLECQDTALDFRTVDILVRNPADGRWDRLKSLTSPGGRLGYFGWSVAMDGDIAVVGAPEFLDANAEGADAGAGAVFIYGRNQGGTNNWGLVRALTGLGTTAGKTVSLSVSTLAIGEPKFNGAGRIHIHSRNTGGADLWGRVLSVAPPAGGGGAKGNHDHPFGTIFDLTTGRLAIGSFDDFSPESNSVLIHEVNNGGVNNWGLAQTITAPSGATKFGWSVACEGTRLGVTYELSGEKKLGLYTGASFSAYTTLSFPGMDSYGPGAIGGDILAVRMMEPLGRVWVSTYRWPEGGVLTSLTLRLAGYGATHRSDGIATTANSLLCGIDDAVSQTAANGAGGVRPMERTVGGTDGWGLWPAVKPEMLGGGGFGKAMAMKGNLLVVGNPDFPAGGSARGLVTVFLRSGDHWSLVTRLTPTPGAGVGPMDNARFGEAVAVDDSGNIVVGAPGENANDGAAYRFEPVPQNPAYQQEGHRYTQTDRFSHTPAGQAGRYGASVAVNSRSMIFGEPEGGASGAGNVWIWVRVTGGWGFTTLSRSDADGNTANDAFGTAMALDGDSLVVTALSDESNGSAYFYEYVSSSWVQRQEILPSDTTTGYFGKSVALKDDRLVIGVFPLALFIIGPGNAFLFNRSGSTWTQKAFLRTSGLEVGDNHGASVALGSDFALVGVPGDDGVSNAASNSGAAFLYNTYGGTTASQFLHEIRPAVVDEYSGSGVVADSIHFAVSAPGSDIVGADSGVIRSYRLGSYERWACGYSMQGGLNNPNDDPDKDGQTNLMEFAMGSNPTLTNSRGNLLFQLTTPGPGTEKYLQGIYLKPVVYSTTYLSAALEGGYTTTSFSQINVTTTTDSSTQLIGRLNKSTTTSTKGFMRLRLNYPSF